MAYLILLKLTIKINRSVFIGLLVLISSCTGADTQLMLANKLCIPNRLVHYASMSEENSTLYSYILFEVPDMPLNVSRSYVKNSNAGRRLLVAVNANSTEINARSKHFKKILDRSIVENSSSYDPGLALYKLENTSDSALSSYYYLKYSTRELKANSSFKINSDWYLALCVEGILGEDSCEISFFYDELLITFTIMHSALYNWESILRIVKDEIKTFTCLTSSSR